ncbi:hypothetical protein GCK72_014255 [Caenorhabditis remanei]|uniref:Uncharacterized protein n=1 Tax=Caenorhabditis remanei TaxID=31234 RepID=A0A6A5GQS2_CAERE|nr:hypothetical protein GCK72_014255 [Caenorhabditis remanei]KAF1757798.1 hypothetical protein GCK72_014255 [Caenorhabditis remanei]
MIGLAAERKSDGNLIVVSPTDGFEFSINEDILNINMIEIGRFCRLDVENNVPTAFTVLENNEIGDLKVNVEKDSVEVSGITGVLTSKLALFYKTTEFGDIACKDVTAGNVGATYKLIISRLPEDQRTGMYSKFVWQGISDGMLEGSKEQKRKSQTKNPSLKKGDTNKKEKEINIENGTKKTSQEKLPKYITGLVTGKHPTSNSCYVSCSLSWPGVDGTAWYSKRDQLKIGDWVEIRYSEADFNEYFPPTPTAETPKFIISNYKKIPKPANYSIVATNSGTEVRIKKFQVINDHEKGNDIEDRFLGTISDGKKLVPDGPCAVDVVIKRRKIFKTASENFTTWFVKECKKCVVGSEKTDNERSPSTESRQSRKKTSEKMKKGKDEKNDSKTSDGKGSVQSISTPQCAYPPGMPFGVPMNWPVGHPGLVGFVGATGSGLPLGQVSPPGYPNYLFPTPLMQPMNGIPLPVFPVNPGFSMKNPSTGIDSKTKRSGNVSQMKEEEEEEEKVIKRAVVTSLIPNKKNKYVSVAYLWLLDDHEQSIFYTPVEIKYDTNKERAKIYPGFFFEGYFEQSEGKWQCKKFKKPLGKLLSGIVNDKSIEFQMTVHQYYPQSQDRLNPETHHVLIGKIIDKLNILPTDCSSGVKICIKMWNLKERNSWCWVVSKVYQSKHIQLLTEFHEAWHKPGVRDMIGTRCSRAFQSIRNLMDTLSEGKISYAENQWKLDSMKTNVETKFAWVTVHDSDFVRMIVFPRSEGQGVNKMKQNVTDKTIYEKVARMRVNRLYRVLLDDKGEVTQMLDCPQYFYADKAGEIEFKFISSDQTLLTNNVALVDPIGMPKWLGKLMFCNPEIPITKRKVIMKGMFRLLDDKDIFVNDEIVSDKGVCFVNTGSVEKLPNQNLDEVSHDEDRVFDRKIVKHEQNVFRTRLSHLSNEVVFDQFKQVCSILRNKEVITEMKKQNIDTDSLVKLQSTAHT